MLRRQYSSIAEEPEDEKPGEQKASKQSALTPIDEQTNDSDIKPIPHRSSTKSSELTVSTDEAIDESESERLSADEDDDMLVELDQNRNLSATTRNGNDWLKHREATLSATPSPDSTKDDSELTENQVREIKEAFLVFDDNGDGCISATELKKLVTSLGYNITEAELMDMMNQIDSDGNGAIDFPEFLQLMSRNLQDADAEDIMMESFKVFDRDNNGNIGTEELQRVMKLLGQDFRDYEIESMIQGADFDADGSVGYEDFTRMMNT